MIPLHALALTLMGRFTNRLYVGYSSWYAIGTLASMQVPFVGFQPVRTSEHMGALGIPMAKFDLSCLLTPPSGVFGLLQIVAFVELVRSHVPSKQFQQLLFVSVIAAGILGALAIVGLTYKGWIAPWTGRFYSLWDTGYAKKWVISGRVKKSFSSLYSGISPLLLPYQSTSLLHGPHSLWTFISLCSSSLRASSCASENYAMSMCL